MKVRSVDMMLIYRHIRVSVSIPSTRRLFNLSTGRILYTPPVGEQVIRDLLANWEQFIHADDDTDPLVKMAVMRYQFEAIHPFYDGNGRTGHILNIHYVIEQGLLTLPILYLSRHVVQHKCEYYRLLNSVTAYEDWQPWLIVVWPNDKQHLPISSNWLISGCLKNARQAVKNHSSIRALCN